MNFQQNRNQDEPTTVPLYTDSQ